jgi:hypothetical protein
MLERLGISSSAKRKYTKAASTTTMITPSVFGVMNGFSPNAMARCWAARTTPPLGEFFASALALKLGISIAASTPPAAHPVA